MGTSRAKPRRKTGLSAYLAATLSSPTCSPELLAVHTRIDEAVRNPNLPTESLLHLVMVGSHAALYNPQLDALALIQPAEVRRALTSHVRVLLFRCLEPAKGPEHRKINEAKASILSEAALKLAAQRAPHCISWKQALKNKDFIAAFVTLFRPWQPEEALFHRLALLRQLAPLVPLGGRLEPDLARLDALLGGTA